MKRTNGKINFFKPLLLYECSASHERKQTKISSNKQTKSIQPINQPDERGRRQNATEIACNKPGIDLASKTTESANNHSSFSRRLETKQGERNRGRRLCSLSPLPIVCDLDFCHLALMDAFGTGSCDACLMRRNEI